MPTNKNISWERGFKRITAVFSSIIAIMGVVLVCIGNGERLALAIAALCFSALPWGIFHLVKWITLGFIDAPEAEAIQPNAAIIRKPSNEPLTGSTPIDPTPIPSPVEAAQPKRRPIVESLWPKLQSEQDALKCINVAVNTALFVAALTGLFAVLALFGSPVLGITGLGLVDSALFLLLAYGTHKKSRLASSALVALYLIEIFAAKNFNVMATLLLIFMSNGMRGIFYLHRDRPFAIIWPRSQWIRRSLVIAGVILSLTTLLSAELFLEYKLSKSFLLAIAYHVIAPKLTGALPSPNNEYKFSFEGTKLEWRRQPSYMVADSANSKPPVFYLVGYPGLLCTVFEESGALEKYEDVQLAVSMFSQHSDKGGKVTGSIDVPGAVKDKFFIFEDKPEGFSKPLVTIEGMFRLPPSRVVKMRYLIYEPTDGTPTSIETMAHDIELISRSFKTTPLTTM